MAIDMPVALGSVAWLIWSTFWHDAGSIFAFLAICWMPVACCLAASSTGWKSKPATLPVIASCVAGVEGLEPPPPCDAGADEAGADEAGADEAGAPPAALLARGENVASTSDGPGRRSASDASPAGPADASAERKIVRDALNSSDDDDPAQPDVSRLGDKPVSRPQGHDPLVSTPWDSEAT